MKAPKELRRWRRGITTKLAREAHRKGLRTRLWSMTAPEGWEVHATDKEFAVLHGLLHDHKEAHQP